MISNSHVGRAVQACLLVIELMFVPTVLHAQADNFAALNRASANYREATMALQKEDLDLALSFLNEAIKIDPTHVKAHALRGLVYGGKGEIEKGITDCTDAIRLCIQYPDSEAYLFRSMVYTGKKEYLDKAIADMNEVIKLEPKNFAGFATRAMLYTLRGDKEKAIADVNYASKLNPKEEENLRGLSNIKEFYEIEPLFFIKSSLHTASKQSP